MDRQRYEKHQNRGQRSGPGENGAAVKLSAEEQKQADTLFNKEAFNRIASDKIAMDRSVRDVRDPKYVDFLAFLVLGFLAKLY